MDLQLFDRGPLEVRCTDAGSFVVERARKLVFDGRCLERDVNLYRERLIGDIALGVGPYPAATLLPKLLTELRTRFPKINTRVEVNTTKYLAEHLRNEDLDFFVADIRNVPAASEFSIVNIGRLSGSFYVRPGHPLLKFSCIKATALLPYGIASVRIPESVREMIGRLMGLAEGVLLPLAIECDDISVLKIVAMTTDSVVACVDAGMNVEVSSGQLVHLEVSDLPPVFADMGVVSLKGRSYSLMAKFAVDYLTSLSATQTE